MIPVIKYIGDSIQEKIKQGGEVDGRKREDKEWGTRGKRRNIYQGSKQRNRKTEERKWKIIVLLFYSLKVEIKKYNLKYDG